MRRMWNAVKKFCREADMLLFCLCVAASLFGLVLVFSAVQTSAHPLRYVAVQGAAMMIGMALFILLSVLDIYDLSDYWKLLLVFNILFAASTFFFGKEINGNRSWILLPFIGISVQPAEVVKVTFILLLARQMYSLRDRISSPLSVGFVCAHFALMAGIIWVASDDMGMVLVYFFIFVCMAFVSGAHLLWFLAGAGVLAAGGSFVWRHLTDYQKMRILVVIDDNLDPLGIGYQAARSKLALGGGQLTGQGLFNGTQTQKGMLPEKQTDFIYSVAGEELGMVGCVLIILLLSAIILRCILVAVRARNGMGSLVCVGVAAMYLFQTFENIGMCVGLTPVIGITLPFFSYGGSSIVTMFAAAGLVSSVKMRPTPAWLRSGEINARRRGETEREREII